jgi:hypothetical protein
MFLVQGVQEDTKREEVTEELRKLYNEELHKLYRSPNIISRRMHVSHMEEVSDARKKLDVKS